MDLILFFVSGIVIALAGTKLSYVADRLADRTGIGEALVGGVLLGASTSIPGSVLSTLSAYEGLTHLAISNAIGGIAAQTFFLVLVDIWYKKSNLEHAAVSSTNLLMTALLAAMLCFPLIAIAMPSGTYWGVHPITPFLLVFYIGGIRYVAAERKEPMWKPTLTFETVEDIPAEPRGGRALSGLWIKFLVLAALLAVAGIVIKTSGVKVAETWGISHTVLGTIMTAVMTSLPELITTFAAVKRGALTLAVGGIVGGNFFDVLFLAFSDIAYREGSLYHEMSNVQISYIALTIVMTLMLMMGLIRREKSGIGNIGGESILIGLFYIGSVFLVLGS